MRHEDNAKTIFVFQSDQFNYFESNYQFFDTTNDGNYLESFKEVNNILYGTFEAQMKGAKLDSSLLANYTVVRLVLIKPTRHSQ